VQERIRVVIVGPDEDGRDRGARVVALALRDAGMEVVWTGAHQSPEQIAATVVQEDADAVGLAGVDLSLATRLAELLRSCGVDDVVVFGGGTEADAGLAAVARVFPPDAPADEIVGWVRATVGS
jgi:methylmalonyl-CoA mutase C-terminal domain/subunit